MTTTALVYEFGNCDVSLHFTIEAVSDGTNTTFTVKVLLGSLDVNALYWSDGDGTISESFLAKLCTTGDTSTADLASDITVGWTLTKSDSALNMNGSNVVWTGDGNASTCDATATSATEYWDGGVKLSNAGLGPNPLTYLTADTSDSYSDTLTFTVTGLDWSQFSTLGVRATSTSTAGGSIKWVDESGSPPEGPPPLDCYGGLTLGFWKTHTELWTHTDSFETTFGIDIADWDPPPPTDGTVSDVSFLEALNLTGGDQWNLARQAAAAVLNAENPEDLSNAYRFNAQEVINAVKWVFGLDADINGDGIIDTNSAADNVYNATLGSQLANLLEWWNHADDDEGNNPLNPNYNPNMPTDTTDADSDPGLCGNGPVAGGISFEGSLYQTLSSAYGGDWVV